MGVFAFLAIFLLCRRMYAAFKYTPLSAKWKSQLNSASVMVIPVYVLAQVFLHEGFTLLVGGAILGALVFYAEREPDFEPFKAVLVSHYPLAAVSVLDGLHELLIPRLIDEYNLMNLAIIGAFVWTIARWVTTKKQREELNFITQQNKMLDKMVAERTSELTAQKEELQQTLQLLQNTQQQLIQSEKLASLGELTAGIAHEIQNPLNFVNNFSEVTMELIDEMEEELGKGDVEEAAEIAESIKQNLEKIIHHGKRADGIVKGMLQHSRASSNVKEPTDVSKLADEYLRLAYHGLRAKDKSFNAELITHFDEKLPTPEMVPQDIGRVLLNLFTNAFYAVHQRQKQQGGDYKPTVEVTTGKAGKSVIIKVRDNGTGIPDSVKDKIMQPFFTTKPTGEGTGLGLSMSYDIIAKGHNGTIGVESKENEFTEFTVTLPA